MSAHTQRHENCARSGLTCLLLTCVILSGAEIRGQEAPDASFAVHPSRIFINSPRESCGILAQAIDEAGFLRDITQEVAFGESSLIEITSKGVAYPSQDGVGVLKAAFRGQSIEIPVQVSGQSGNPPIPSFEDEVVPILTRSGCNTGGCHGASSGKADFHLSLFGYDPDKDYLDLTREFRGRRTDPVDPEASLFLKKATRTVSHKGGRRIDIGSPEYDCLVEWISLGAPSGDQGRPEPRELVVTPDIATLPKHGAPTGLLVMAHYPDGTQRDVTHIALISSSNPGSARVQGRHITPGEPGEAHLLVRFRDLAAISTLTVVDPQKPIPEFSIPNHPIDGPITRKLKAHREAPAVRCDDTTFLRRVTLDILNVLPTPDQVRAFMADDSPLKRSQLIDRLLEDDRFNLVWANRFAEILRVEEDRLEAKGMHLFTDYLIDGFRNRRPITELVHEMLTVKGGNFHVAPSNFMLVERTASGRAEHTAQAFLGIRIQCAQCHNHPFERWTMDDYYGFTAFFAQASTKRTDHPKEFVVYDRGTGQARNPTTGRVVPPTFLGSSQPKIERGADRRAALAEWMTGKDNPWFARNLANRIFARFFGRGLVEPVDDVRVSNPPSHPDVLDWLAKVLVDSNYDFRVLVRTICNSVTYQLAPRADQTHASLFAGAPIRRLTAEQLLDAIDDVTGVITQHRGLPEGIRALELRGGEQPTRFLEVFGRPPRTSSCTCDRRQEPTLTQALHLINGNELEAKLLHKSGRLAKLLAAKASDHDIISELVMAAYGRPPTRDELARLAVPKEGKVAREPWFSDVLWALLNSKEFLFNH